MEPFGPLGPQPEVMSRWEEIRQLTPRRSACASGSVQHCASTKYEDVSVALNSLALSPPLSRHASALPSLGPRRGFHPDPPPRTIHRPPSRPRPACFR